MKILVGNAFFYALLLTFCTKQALAEEHLTVALELSCPPEIQISETLDEVPKDWTGQVLPMHHWLQGAVFASVDFSGSDSDQSELSDLLPDQELAIDARGSIKSTWIFPDSKAIYVLKCFYSGTSMVLTQKLPEGIRACELTQLESHGAARLSKARCFR